jgi:hypothetical protein
MLSRSPHATAVSLDDDSMIVLHLRTQEYYRLNETGQWIWMAFDQQDEWEVGDLARDFHREVAAANDPDLSLETVCEDVEAFVEMMIDSGLLTRT